MNFIKKVRDKNFDESVHAQFQKFSKGEFRNKAAISAKFSGGKYTINTGPEFANELVRTIAKKMGSKKTRVEGAVISTLDLKEDLKFKEIKQFQGVKKYFIELEMSGLEIIDLLDRFPKAFFALSFSTEDDTSLKIKAKAPKSGKPGTKEGEITKPNFCKIVTKDKNLAESFVFENPEFKKADIIHDFFIDRIEMPEELKNSKDFSLIREKSRRIGSILRRALIDDKKSETKLELRA